jgi:molybdenum cofactor cytidylyltransferase
MLAVVVLAAGAGSRMGGVAKCLITVDGETLLQRLLRAVHTLAPVQTVLVLGHHADAVHAALHATPTPQPLTLVHNPDPGDSPTSSLRLGLLALMPNVDTVMVLLADQPLLGAKDLQSALQAFAGRSPAQHIGWPVHHGEPGHPVLMQASLARDWLAQDRTGLRPWAMQRLEQVAQWHTDSPNHTRDLDTLEALARLAKDTGKTWTLPQTDAKNRQT